MAVKRRFQTTIVRDGSMCFIPVPLDPKEAFGKARAPVNVTLNGYTYRSTIASMGDGSCLPLRKSNREAAGLEGGETLDVTLELDEEERTVALPSNLRAALRAAGCLAGFEELSYSARLEHVEAILGAKKPETREKRLEAAVKAATEKASKTAKRRAPSATKAAATSSTKPARAQGRTTKP